MHPTPDFEQCLLALTWQQLREHGLLATNMDSLAKQLGVSKKTIYKHFGSKQELVAAAFQQYDARCRQQLLALLQHPAPGKAAWLQAMQQFHDELSTELSVSICQELLHRAPEHWLGRHLFARSAMQQLLACQLRAAQAETTPAPSAHLAQ